MRLTMEAPVAVTLGVNEVDAGLIQRHGGGGGQDADVMKVRLGGISVTVTVDGQAVHTIDVYDSLPVPKVIGNGFSRLRQSPPWRGP